MWRWLCIDVAGAAIAVAAALFMPAPTHAAALVPWSKPNPPSFHLPQLGTPAAATFSLNGQSGDIVLIHFFASWCEPCRDELPALKRLAERGAPKLTMVAIAVADADRPLRRLIDETGVTFSVLLDRDRAVARAWSIAALPSTVILDSRHRARLVVESDFAWDTIEPNQLTERLSPPEKDASQ